MTLTVDVPEEFYGNIGLLDGHVAYILIKPQLNTALYTVQP